MCSIVGYVGDRHNGDVVFQGLSRLEYRGYDSVGYGWIEPGSGKIESIKAIGSVIGLSAQMKAISRRVNSGIGHTRWATHGAPTLHNAHPQFDCERTIAIVHNGTIENNVLLKRELEHKGHFFQSATDTEVIAHLLEDAVGNDFSSLIESIVYVVNRLEGAYSLLCLFEKYPDMLVAIRKRSPLCVGYAVDGCYVASDPFAFSAHLSSVTFMPDETIALVKNNNASFYNFDGHKISLPQESLSYDNDDMSTEGHQYYMVKEIFEQRDCIHKTLFMLEDQSSKIEFMVPYHSLKKIRIIACGTSWHAGLMAKHFFESRAQIEVVVHLASEFRHYPSVILMQEPETLYLFISQSGETADTLESLRQVRQLKSASYLCAITNSAMSTLAREADMVMLTRAGREIAVASTKAFTSQVALLYWYAHQIGYWRGFITYEDRVKSLCAVKEVAGLLESTLKMYQKKN